jgi:hypothetical protein
MHIDTTHVLMILDLKSTILSLSAAPLTATFRLLFVLSLLLFLRMPLHDYLTLISALVPLRPLLSLFPFLYVYSHSHSDQSVF